MDLKIELKALIQIKDELTRCQTELDEIPRVINNQISAITTWKGIGKGKYMTILEPLRSKSENCSSKIANSAMVLLEALQKYHESDNGLFAQNNQLSADDIF